MLKNTAKYLIIILLISIGFSSCKEDPTTSDIIKRKWDYSHSENKEGLVGFWNFKINQANKLQYFNQTVGNDTITGLWNLVGDTLVIERIPEVTGIDSVAIQLNSDGSYQLSLRNNRFEAGKIIADQFSIAGKEEKYLIASISQRKLELTQGKTTKSFYYTPTITPTYVSFETILRGILGMFFLIGIAWLFSSNRKAINWNLVIKGLILQIVIALLVLKVSFVSDIFDHIAFGFKTITDFTTAGTDFLFTSFVEGKQSTSPPLINFAFTILPTIIFFSALMSLLYYWGVLQKIVFVFAWIMKKFMNLSGAESLAAAGNVFLGQTESPLLVKPYLLGMTKSEIMCLMTGGMATVAGGVLASYISFLGAGDPAQEIFYAKHLLTASIISAPAAVIAAKMLVPESEKINNDLKISKDKIGTNALEAISNGTTDGLKLAVNVGAMLLVFTALIAFLNYMLHGAGDLLSVNEAIANNTFYSGLSMQMILGYICGPFMWILGIESGDMWAAGELLGTKTVLNEFFGYIRLAELKSLSQDQGGISERTAIMATYMLCGFANFASIGIQIGGIGALVPSRKGLLSSLGFKALIGGTLACLFTMVVVGMLV